MDCVLPSLDSGWKDAYLRVIQSFNCDVEYDHLAADRGFDGPNWHCPWHCNISKWPYPRKRILGPHSAIMEPRERSANRFASQTCTTSRLRVVFDRWKAASHWFLGQQCILMGYFLDG
jgi:hypothetical protein